MAKTQEATENSIGTPPGLGDISVIRNILFGQQTAEFQSSFESFKARMDAKDAEHDERFNRLEAHFKQQIEAMTANTNQQMQQLEAKLKQSQEQLSEKIAATSKNDKAMLGHLLMDIGKKLAE
jgi:septin family protein